MVAFAVDTCNFYVTAYPREEEDRSEEKEQFGDFQGRTQTVRILLHDL
jgi:hypothetical protein